MPCELQVRTDCVARQSTASKRNYAAHDLVTALLVASFLFAHRISLHAQQLPDAPSVVAPLKRYSFNLGMDSKYSLTTSVVEFTPRIGVSMRLGDRETVGLSYSHPMPGNGRSTQSNSVIVWTNFRVLSWGKIPRVQ